MNRTLLTVLMTVVLSFGLIILAGCESDAQTGGLLGAGIGAGIGALAGGDTEGTLIGAAIGGGAGYILGNESDKKKANTSQVQAQPSGTETVWVTNSNGSRTPVKLTRNGQGYVGPKGEMYSTKPTEKQLKQAYGF